MALVKLIFLIVALTHRGSNSRAVNLSSVWLLPEEGYPVFYRYFRDRITWYEADAVCQFHHGELITVDSSNQFDATRAYLKELDVANYVWTGLKRGSPEQEFLWPGSKPMENPEGHWAVYVPKASEPLCAAIDPSSDYRWHPLSCSGPAIAAFVCQMPVPSWAMKEDGCMITSLPSLTITFLPEQGAVELSSDCGLDGTRRITCKGKTNREQLFKQLACEASTEASIRDVWDETQPTRHRRDSEVTSDMSIRSNTTDEMPAVADSVTTQPTTTFKLTTIGSSTTGHTLPTTIRTSTIAMVKSTSSPTKMYEASKTKYATSTEKITTVEGKWLSTKLTTAASIVASSKIELTTLPSTPATSQSPQGQLEVAIPLIHDKLNMASSFGKRQSSKPIPPSLKGNSPFVDPSSISSSTELPTQTTPGPGSPTTRISELVNGTSDEIQGPPDSHEILGGPQEENRSRGPLIQSPTNPSLEQYKKNIQDSGEDHPEDGKDAEGWSSGGVVGSVSGQTGGAARSKDGLQAETLPTPDALAVGGASEGALERPNRSRLLVHPQHHSFYAYFLNRVLG